MKSHNFTIWSLCVAFCGLAFVLFWPENDADKMEKVLISLLKQEKSAQVKPQLKIAVGYGACKDIFVQASDVIDKDSKPKNKLQNHNQIENMDELLEMFGYFFSHGAAAERFCPNDQLFEQLVNKALKSSHFRVALGGNAPVMSNRFALEGADEILLAAKMTASFKENAHENIQVTGANVDQDDIHLILEYKRNEKWSHWIAPRANRFIIHSDRNNPTVSSIESFDEPLAKFKPDLLVVSGLQMMDNYPFAPGERQTRLAKVKEQMIGQSLSKTRVHFEMASFVDVSLLQDLVQFVIPNADSLGMNEQELPNLRSMLLYGNVSVVSDSNPRIATALDQMRDVYRILNTGQRPLTRMHLHTLAYQAILVSHGSAWKNTRFAAAKASLTANRHVCASPKVDVGKALLLMDDSFSTSTLSGSERKLFNDERPVACWKETIPGSLNNPEVEICLSPNLVCSEAKQTAGGGDNISAAGLILQI